MSRYTLHNVHICVCTSKREYRIYTCSNPIELGGVSKVTTKHIQSFSTSESALKNSYNGLVSKIAIAFPYLRAHGCRPFLYAKRLIFRIPYAVDFTRAVNLYAHV